MTRRYSTAKDLDRLAREKVREGWSVTHTGSGHLKWEHPRGGCCFSASTPKDSLRAHKHALAKIRRVERQLT